MARRVRRPGAVRLAQRVTELSLAALRARLASSAVPLAAFAAPFASFAAGPAALGARLAAFGAPFASFAVRLASSAVPLAAIAVPLAAVAAPVAPVALIAASGAEVTVPGGSVPRAVATADTLRLTLAEATERALSEAPRLARLEALERAADAAARSARAAGRPEVGLSAGYSRLSEVPEFAIQLPGAGRRVIAPDVPNAWRSRVSLTAPLFTGGRIAGAVSAAEREREGARLDRADGAADLALETANAYWRLVLARAHERVVAEALTAYEAHLTDARNRERTGLAARHEVLALEVERDRAELSRLRARHASGDAEDDLRRLLGVDAWTPVRAVEPLEGPAVGSPAAGDPSGAVDDAALRERIDSLTATAMARRPDRAALAGRVLAAEARVGSERAGRWPQLSVAAGYDLSRPNRRYLPADDRWRESWDASVNLSLALFDFGRTAAAVERAQQLAAAGREQLEDLDRRIAREVAARVRAVVSAEEGLEVAERALASARENLRVLRDRYREGVSGSSERLDAEVLLMRAGLERADALADVRLSRAALARAVGAEIR